MLVETKRIELTVDDVLVDGRVHCSGNVVDAELTVAKRLISQKHAKESTDELTTFDAPVPASEDEPSGAPEAGAEKRPAKAGKEKR